MINIILIAYTLILSTSLGISNVNNLKKNNDSIGSYFEGEIHFTIKYDSIPTYLNEDYLENAIGSKMILTFKNGNHKKEYYSPSGELLSQRFLDLSSKKF